MLRNCDYQISQKHGAEESTDEALDSFLRGEGRQRSLSEHPSEDVSADVVADDQNAWENKP